MICGSTLFPSGGCIPTPYRWRSLVASRRGALGDCGGEDISPRGDTPQKEGPLSSNMATRGRCHPLLMFGHDIYAPPGFLFLNFAFIIYGRFGTKRFEIRDRMNYPNARETAETIFQIAASLSRSLSDIKRSSRISRYN